MQVYHFEGFVVNTLVTVVATASLVWKYPQPSADLGGSAVFLGGNIGAGSANPG